MSLLLDRLIVQKPRKATSSMFVGLALNLARRTAKSAKMENAPLLVTCVSQVSADNVRA